MDDYHPAIKTEPIKQAEIESTKDVNAPELCNLKVKNENDQQSTKRCKIEKSEGNYSILHVEEKSFDVTKLKDVLCKVLRMFNGNEWITAPQIALRMRESDITMQDIREAACDNSYTLSQFLLSYPDAFITQIIWDYKELCDEINSGKLLTPSGRFPPLPVCRWSISQKICNSVEQYVQQCNKVPQQVSRTCTLCRIEGGVWYGHHEATCKRYRPTIEDMRHRHMSGVPIPTAISSARKTEKERLEQQRISFEELKKAKADMLQRKKENPWGVHLGGVPFSADDEVTALELDIPSTRFQFIIGREGKNIQLLQEQYEVLIKIPFKSSSNQKAYIKGRVDKVRDAKILLEEKYNDPQSDVYKDVEHLPPPSPPPKRQPPRRGSRKI